MNITTIVLYNIGSLILITTVVYLVCVLRSYYVTHPKRILSALDGEVLLRAFGHQVMTTRAWPSPDKERAAYYIAGSYRLTILKNDPARDGERQLHAVVTWQRRWSTGPYQLHIIRHHSGTLNVYRKGVLFDTPFVRDEHLTAAQLILGLLLNPRQESEVTVIAS